MTNQQFLRGRGWKRYMGVWWFKPREGWNGRIAPGQQIHGTEGAVELERRLVLVRKDGTTAALGMIHSEQKVPCPLAE